MPLSFARSVAPFHISKRLAALAFSLTFAFAAPAWITAQIPAAAALPDAPSALLAAAPQPASSPQSQPVSPQSQPTTLALNLSPLDRNLHRNEDGNVDARVDEIADSSSSSAAVFFALDPQQSQPQQPVCAGCDVDANGKPIPLERQQPHRILGFMPNFRTVSAGARVHPPGWKYNFTVASHQALDYSTFLFLGLTSLTAEGMDSHPSLGKGVGGFWGYTWRGFLDKTDGTYLSAWLLPSLLHQDTRYYPLGAGHPIVERALYVISRQAVSKTYGGHDTPAFATLGGKALTQLISRTYYPSSSENFSVLASKFGYSVMRDVAFSSIREFYPDIAAHYIKKHREKVARQAPRDAQTTQGTQSTPSPHP
ncbi:MAG TPA: hypothetical protein VIJ65_08100 [Acidobacteriaceae bacterium]